MTVPSGTLQTYAAVGNREDLSDIIFRTTPTDTPFLSALERVSATAVKHEWLTEDLAAAANNKIVEGDDAGAATATSKTRWDNYCQISEKVASISGTQEAVKKAGRNSEMKRELLAKGLEMKRDMEFAIMQNTTYNAGGASTARQTRGLEGWIYSNDVLGSAGSPSSPVPASNTAPTDGTAEAYTEARLKSCLALIWANGGNPTSIFLGAAQKQTQSGFSGNATRQQDVAANKLVAGYDVYVSDFGRLKLIPSRQQRARTVFVLDMDYWKLAELRSMATEDLAKTGDSIRKHMISEYALEACNEKASGAVRDCT